MATIDVLQRSTGIAIAPEKQSGISLVRAVFVQMEIQRGEQLGKISRAGAAMAVEDSMQTCHKQGGRNAISENIRQHEPYLSRTEIEKIVVISSNHSSLDAVCGVVESA